MRVKSSPTSGAYWLAIAMLTMAACAGSPGTSSHSTTDPASNTASAVVSTESSVMPLIADYLDSFFAHYPSRATAAGRRDFDLQLEDFSAERRASWIATNHDIVAALQGLRAAGDLEHDDALDAELVERQALREIDALVTRDRSSRDPLYWTGVLSNATVFLLVRDDQPLAERLAAATARAEQIPRLAAQARAELEPTPREQQAPEFFRLAAGQARASADFYRDRFAAGVEDPERAQAMAAAGGVAATALDALATFLDARADTASGSPRLRAAYAETFRLATGIERPVSEVLAGAVAALDAKRAEAATYGRTIWAGFFDAPPPSDDVALLRRLFARVAEDAAPDVETFVEDYRTLIDDAIAFVRARDVITLPEPLTLYTDRSPSYFLGQSVGGVYAAGPYAPEADTLFYLPSPSDDASDAQKAAFFRDFNHHFNVMITPHELVPGHYLQLKMAVRHPRKVRALFGDGVYIEGWGTFCERLMLDLGWGGPLARVAHLKKQLENIARTIVDIRVHTEGMTRASVLAFVRDEALQDEQFAGNMWTRAITSAPQLTSYFLGYQQVMALYDDVRVNRGDAFALREFMDGMMAMGPVPVRHYRAQMIGDTSTAPER